MDFAKAFDRIDHSMFLATLSNFLLDPFMINLLFTYLTNRRQAICISGEKSSVIIHKSSSAGFCIITVAVCTFYK